MDEEIKDVIKAIINEAHDETKTHGYDIIKVITKLEIVAHGCISIERWELEELGIFEKQEEPDPHEPYGLPEIDYWELILCLIMREQQKLAMVENLNERLDEKSIEAIINWVIYNLLYEIKDDRFILPVEKSWNFVDFVTQ